MENRFPRTVKAGMRVDASQWAFADALKAEVEDTQGGPNGYKAAVAELARHGLDYSTERLRILRQSAEIFPPSRRYDGEHNNPIVSHRVHTVAGNPDMLDVIVKAGRKDGKAISQHYVEEVMRRVRQEEREQRSEAYTAAKADRDKADNKSRAAAEKLKHAPPERRDRVRREYEAAKEQRDRARQRVAETRMPPNRSLPPPKEEEVGGLLQKMRFSADISSLHDAIRRLTKEITPSIEAGELPATFVNAAMEELIECQTDLTKLIALIRKAQGGKRSHLHAV